MLEDKEDQPELYKIVIKGHLDNDWSEWFGGLTITPTEHGETVLSGPIVDQSALHGLLIKIRDLGLPLLSLTRIEERRTGDTPSHDEIDGDND